MSQDPAAFRFEPKASGPADPSIDPAADRRRRVLVLGAGAVLVALAGASVANSQHASLRCVDGTLVAYRGRLLPLGEMPLVDPELPPLSVPEDACEDEDFESLSELRERYREVAMGWADEAIRSEDVAALETSLDALQGLRDDDGGIAPRHREIMEALLRHEVQQASDSHDRARRRLEQARQLGVSEQVLRSAETALGELASATPQPTSPAVTPPAPEPAEPPADLPSPTPAEPAPPSTSAREL
ncbi:MAG: hypothetical protein AB1Z98_37135 [Nannocystaceae bacterium]